MGLTLAIVAAIFASFSNFFMRRSIDGGGSSKAYLVVQMTFSFLLMILLNPVKSGNYEFSAIPVVLGLIGGVVLGALMWGIGKSLEKGPPGLTFAVVNSATVMPGILMVILFGPLFGHPYNLLQGIGSFLVVAGLFWAGWTSEENPNKKAWALLITFVFVAHALYLVYLNWWALLIRPAVPDSPLLPFTIDVEKISWFMPAILFSASLVQWVSYLRHECRMPTKRETLYGISGGVSNGLCSYFLIIAPQLSAPWENAMLFPVFAVCIILICNTWARILYHEEVNWKANALAIIGLVIGTVQIVAS